MVKPCVVSLDSDDYYAGQIINGKVECNFLSKQKVTAIRVRFKGRAKVKLYEKRIPRIKHEVFFDIESELLQSETTLLAGKHEYPFRFNLPFGAPPTLKLTFGQINYFAEAIIERPWAIDYKDTRVFKVHSYIDLNMMPYLQNPFVFSEVKKPTLLSVSEPITFTVLLPKNGYVPTEMVAFTAKLKNQSNVNVQAMRFKFVQRYTFRIRDLSEEIKTVKGQVFEVINSLVTPGDEKLWDLEMRIPKDILVEHTQYCKLIKSVVELKGKAILPLPHNNLLITVPITLGSVPFR